MRPWCGTWVPDHWRDLAREGDGYRACSFLGRLSGLSPTNVPAAIQAGRHEERGNHDGERMGNENKSRTPARAFVKGRQADCGTEAPGWAGVAPGPCTPATLPPLPGGYTQLLGQSGLQGPWRLRNGGCRKTSLNTTISAPRHESCPPAQRRATSTLPPPPPAPMAVRNLHT